MKIKCISINNFSIIPVTRYIINELSILYPTHVQEFSLRNQYKYSNIQNYTSIGVFTNTTLFKNQSRFLKFKKYLFTIYKIVKDVFHTNKVVYYTPDFQVIFFLVVFKLLFKKKKWYVIYHQFELIEHKYLGKIEARVFQFILDHIECVNFCIFPEINRIEYFKSLVNKEFSYQLFPNTCYVNDDIDLTVPKELSNIPKNHVIIGHVGNLGENHYLDFYIELIEGCKNSFFTFVFIGRYSSNLLKRLKNIDNNNIIIINELPHSELKYFYNFMHYGVILYKGVDLNFEYCAPNKLYEYWSYGISIIAHSLIGLKSLDFSKNMGKLYNLENQLSLVQIKEDLQNNTVNREIVKSEFVEKYDQNLYINTIKTLVEKISMH